MEPQAVELLAFGFGNLPMLGWLAAAAAPVVIHLWSRRNYRLSRWAAVRFLLAAIEKHARRIQLQHWLLLAVRTLIVVLTVMAVAEPYTGPMGLSPIAGRRTHKVLVIDGSYSMAYRSEDRSRFARAKEIAIDIVRESVSGEGFSLILMSSPPRVVATVIAFAPQELVEEISNLDMSHGGGDLLATLDRVENVIRQARKDHPEWEQTEVIILSDLGRTSWAPAGQSEAQQAARNNRFAALAQHSRLVVIDLGQADFANLAVTDLRTTDAFVTRSREVTFEAVVRNFGHGPPLRHPKQHPLQWLVDGVPIGRATVDLPPGEQTTVRFSHVFLTPGSHRVEARLGADSLDVDSLDLDNHRHLAVTVKRHLRALCISGKPGSTYYLARALDPAPSERSIIRAEEAAESQLVDLPLADYDCIFLCNVAQFTTQEARLMRAYLDQGGGLVFFLGDQVIADRYNRELAATDGSARRVLPARLGDVVQGAVYHFAPEDYYDHPMIAVFRDRERSGLPAVSIFRYFRLEVPTDWPAARVVLAFDDGVPAIVEEPIESGRSIVVATAASFDPNRSDSWTTLPASPSFLPLVRQLLARAVQPSFGKFNVHVGEPLTATVSLRDMAAALSITTPDGQTTPVRVRRQADVASWSFDAVDKSGFYGVVTTGPRSETQHFAVNLDTRESDLSKADAAQLSDNLLVETSWHGANRPTPGDVGPRTELHKWFLTSVLVLLLFETFLAWRFGRATA